VEKGALISKGKAKSLYATDDSELFVLHFRDDTSAFDGKKVAQLTHKGAVNNQFNAFIMAALEDAGIATHFVRRLNATESIVKRLTMIPVECVVRNAAAGSLCRRYGIEEGSALSPAVFEFFYKDDGLGDPMINDSHIVTFGWATEAQIAQMKKLTLQVNEVLSQLFAKGNLLLVDFKLEFGLIGDQIVLGDEFSPDGCRLWDKDSREKMDKDRFRQDLGNVIESYQDVGERIGIQFEF